MAWASDDRTFVTSELPRWNEEKPEKNFLRIRDAQSGKLIRSISYPHWNDQGRAPIRYLGSGKEIAAQIDGGGIGIWEVETGID